MTTIASVEPDVFNAGSTVTWKRALADYPSPTWTLDYFFRELNGTARFTVQGTNSDGDHLLTLANTATAALSPGEYRWIARVNDGTTYTDLGSGVLEVKPNPDGGAGDLRSRDERLLDAVRGRLENRYSAADVRQYSIAGRSVSVMDGAELLALEEKLAARVVQARNKERRESGQKRRRVSRIRFGGR